MPRIKKYPITLVVLPVVTAAVVLLWLAEAHPALGHVMNIIGLVVGGLYITVMAAAGLLFLAAAISVGNETRQRKRP
jgi:high-affinity nickel permease